MRKNYMNIFVLSYDPIEAAQLQCSKHVTKMLLETAQLLSAAHRILDNIPPTDGLYYKVTHKSHPSTLWVMESVENYNWTYQHFIGLCDEYTYGYGKIHKTDEKLRTILATPPQNIKYIPMTPFKLAMKSNPECMSDDAVDSYRKYYRTKKDKFKMVWTKRDVPSWML